MRHLRFALRTLLGDQAYLFAMVVLAAAIGISTAVFSIAQAVLFQPLPFPRQNDLRIIWKADVKSGVPFLELAYPELLDLQSNVTAFESVAVMPTTLYGYGKIIRSGKSAPVQVESAPVSHDFFKTLRIAPMLGRDFSDADEHPGAAPVTVLSYSTWRSIFHSDRSIVGRPLTLNGQGYRVIGVMGPQIDFPRGVGLWVPMGVSRDLENRSIYFMQAIARIKPGYSDNQVAAQVNGLFRRLAKEYSGYYSPTQQAVITSLPGYWVGSARPQLLVSLGASFLLLFTGWVTAANLFLSRTLARSQEIATRSSLGADTFQILIQFLTEGMIAALIAGAAGFGLAALLIRILVAMAPADIPRLADAGISRPVVGFGIVLSFATGLACSLAPTFIATRMNLESALREGGVRLTGSRRGRRIQNLFTVGQVAITVVLLAAAVMVVISVRDILNTDTGFARRDAVTMNLALRGPEMDEVHRRILYTNLLDRLRQNPQVAAAGAVLVRPLEGTIGWDMPFQSQFDPFKRPEELPVSNFEVITPGYLQTVGTPLLEGRDFGDQDRETSAQSVIVSRGLAERIRRQGHAPLGTLIRLGRHSGNDWWKIVGIAANARYRGISTRGDDIYVNYRQSGIPVNYLAIRGRTTSGQLAGLVQTELSKLDAGQAIASIATIGELMDRDTARQRFNMTLLLIFGVAALSLAAAGVYSVVAENVAMRTREIAVRLALGADHLALVRNLSGGILGFVLIGEVVGLLLTLASGTAFADLLYGDLARNPLVLVMVVGFLFVVALIAASIPAWIAAGREPRRAL